MDKKKMIVISLSPFTLKTIIPAQANMQQDNANIIINDDIGYTVDVVEVSENVEVQKEDV